MSMNSRIGTVVATVVAAAIIFAGSAYGAPPPPPEDVNSCDRKVSILDGPTQHEGTGRFGATTPFVFTVISQGCSQPGSVYYGTVSVMADSADFPQVSGVLTFASGDMTAKTIVVNVRQDSTNEAHELFLVGLCGTTGMITVVVAWSNGIILNDDGPTSPGVPHAEGHCSR